MGENWMVERTFDQWFIKQEIHEVITCRSELLAEHINDAGSGYTSMAMAHERITTMLKEAYEQGKNDV
jgi:hypothetical protein